MALALGSVQGCCRIARVFRGPGIYGVLVQVEHISLYLGITQVQAFMLSYFQFRKPGLGA
jgi:hypothetical protein